MENVNNGEWIARMLLLILLPAFFSACSNVPEVEIRYETGKLRFSGEKALTRLAEFVGSYPNRHSGAPNNEAAAEWLRTELSRSGLDSRTDEWRIVNYSREVVLRNVVARIPGESPFEVVVLAHHDQAPTTIQGADNDGSGIAILLQLAEIFAAEQPLRHTLVFVCTLGARRFIASHPDTRIIGAGVSLDNLGKRWYDGMNMEATGQFRGYGDLGLLLTAREAARAAGDLWIPRIKSPIEQILEQAVPISFMDQGPLVAVGVPALGFAASFPDEFAARVWETFHTPEDTVVHQSAESLEQSGRIAEALLRELLSLEELSRRPGPYLYFDGTKRVLRGAPLWLIFVLVVLLFFLAGFLFNGTSFKMPSWRTLLLHFLSLWLPLLSSVLLLYILVGVELLDEYAVYPATQKDPALLNPRWLSVGIFIVGAAALFLLFSRLKRWLLRRVGITGSPEESRKSFAFSVIGLAALYILVVNPFSLLFLIPVFLWSLGAVRRGAGRILDIILFVLGGLVVYGLLYFFGFVILKIDFLILWYLMNMISSGMVSFPTMAAVTAVIASGLLLIVRLPEIGGKGRKGLS
jgi:hypothetical protein